MYSAIKVNGKKLYELARAGVEVERKKRVVNIYDIQIIEMDLPRVRFAVRCSKGTYIRTLCHDIGAYLQVGGCMAELCRTQVGRFQLQNSYTLSEIEAIVAKEQLDNVLVAVDKLFEQYQSGLVIEAGFSKAINGSRLEKSMVQLKRVAEVDECIRLYNKQEQFIGIYQYQKEEVFKLVKMFYVL